MGAALQRVNDHLGKSLLPTLFSVQAPDIEQIIIELVNDITALKKPLILVIEDYHLIENVDVHASITSCSIISS